MVAPDAVKRNRPIAEQVRGVGGKRSEPAGREDDADEVGHIGGVDDLINRTGADDKCRRPLEVRKPLAAVEDKVAREIEDDLNAAIWQDALAAMRGRLDLRIPQHPNGRRERGGGDALQVNQDDLDAVIARRAMAMELCGAVFDETIDFG